LRPSWLHSYSPTGFAPGPLQLRGRVRFGSRLLRRWGALAPAVLDIDEKLVPSARADVPDGPELLIAALREHLESDRDRFGPLRAVSHPILLARVEQPSRMLFVSLDARDASPDHARLRGRATPTARPRAASGQAAPRAGRS